MSSHTNATTAPSANPTAAGVLCVAPLQLAPTPEDERAWRELALAERKQEVAEREQRLAMEMKEREMRLQASAELHNIDLHKRDEELQHGRETHELSRKRMLAEMEAETSPEELKRRVAEAAVIRLTESLLTASTPQRALAIERPLIDRLMDMGSFKTVGEAQKHVDALRARAQAPLRRPTAVVGGRKVTVRFLPPAAPPAAAEPQQQQQAEAVASLLGLGASAL